jgi:hypothetical protein
LTASLYRAKKGLRSSAGKELPVKRKEFIQELQKELGRHRKDYFTSAGYVAPGCVLCKDRLNTNGQYLEHLLVDVLPGAVEKILNVAKTIPKPTGRQHEVGH